MCGIAGFVDLAGQARVPPGMLAAMAAAIVHRGPDEDGFFEEPGVGLASRRLSIVGLADGRQPIANEDGSVRVIFNGELFEYPEKRAELEAQGHRFATHTDTELLPHLYEQYGEQMFAHVRGQFAFCLYDARRRVVILARDRVGICPLFWTVRRVGEADCLLFASEIKALLASGVVPAEANVRGLDQVFTYFGTPGPVTCFAGVQQLLPGQYLRIELGQTRPETLTPRVYWELDFPERGHELDPPGPPQAVVNRFEQLFIAAVSRRLRADVPVVSYLSGGIDSSVVVAVASKVLGRPIPTFTIGVDYPGLNEESHAAIVARHVGTQPVVVKCRHADVLAQYPALIRAAEVPVVDTSCAALLMLARSVREHGYKVALTGEGSDEWLGGYPWFKGYKATAWMDQIPGIPLGRLVRRAVMASQGIPRYPQAIVDQWERVAGGPNAWLIPYGLMSTAKLRFYSQAMWERLGGSHDYEELQLPTERLARWHPLHRSVYFGARIQLQGLLLASKGDRVAMHSSVEVRYPFLDDDLMDFVNQLAPRWKLRGLRDKYILRRMASRWLPRAIAWRPKAMFRAPMDSFHLEDAPAFVDQLLSRDSLNRTGYFDFARVDQARKRVTRLRRWSLGRQALEMGLVAVTATQLWHHLHLGGGLCELPA
jgi:asparagine synthase (glutamine-hydrolysing)